MYEEIYDFINFPHVRSGEFEANELIIKKQIYLIFLLEYVFPNDVHREISCCTSIYRDDLNTKINEYAIRYGYTLKS
ncbi:hypothetical protein FC756_27150 [Lysinibacillus mangiferihumi]|uniref:Uncharacterized protein n=1 Tax=Lysinibacillus mangiferihumi TaxID=1130819 RepID=A0A4V5TQM5_9BACI|nr:hypothetical protein FC756_27150 [Lysinibacillus mangiferihumi]